MCGTSPEPAGRRHRRRYTAHVKPSNITAVFKTEHLNRPYYPLRSPVFPQFLRDFSAFLRGFSAVFPRSRALVPQFAHAGEVTYLITRRRRYREAHQSTPRQCSVTTPRCAYQALDMAPEFRPPVGGLYVTGEGGGRDSTKRSMRRHHLTSPRRHDLTALGVWGRRSVPATVDLWNHEPRSRDPCATWPPSRWPRSLIRQVA